MCASWTIRSQVAEEGILHRSGAVYECNSCTQFYTAPRLRPAATVVTMDATRGTRDKLAYRRWTILRGAILPADFISTNNVFSKNNYSGLCYFWAGPLFVIKVSQRGARQDYCTRVGPCDAAGRLHG